ncbi:uncharacterized protein [Elaeis guineensis]|uniref:uncharacterized protein n=1 Tax=Elaeis guineensis var. tenera TaxID=51953 RepID=UPI003C6CEA50
MWGPVLVLVRNGVRYFLTLIDDFSRKIWVFFLRKKLDVFSKFKVWKAEVETEQGCSVKCLRSDNGEEFTNREFQEFYEECACYLMNQSPHTRLEGGIFEEKWSGKKVELNHLRVFECTTHVHMAAGERSKLDAKSKKVSPKQWYKHFDSYVRSIGLSRCEHDPCVYVKTLENESRLYLLLYMDDMLITCRVGVVQELKVALSREFEMKDLGPARKILGMKILKDRVKKLLYLSQGGYIEKVLEKFGMKEAKLVAMPLVGHYKLSKGISPQFEVEDQEMERVPYASRVGSLMYATVEYIGVTEVAKEALWLKGLLLEMDFVQEIV